MWSPNVVSKWGTPKFGPSNKWSPNVDPQIWSPKCGPQMWSPNVVPKCGPQVWSPSVVHKCGPPNAVPKCGPPNVVRKCGHQVWSPNVVHKCPKLVKWSSVSPTPTSHFPLHVSMYYITEDIQKHTHGQKLIRYHIPQCHFHLYSTVFPHFKPIKCCLCF